MERTVYALSQCFSIRSDFCLQKTSSMSEDIFGSSNGGAQERREGSGEVSTTSFGDLRSGMLLNILQFTELPPTKKVFPAQNFNSARLKSSALGWRSAYRRPMDERAANWVQRTQTDLELISLYCRRLEQGKERARGKNISSKLKKQNKIFLPPLYRYQTFMFRQNKD